MVDKIKVDEIIQWDLQIVQKNIIRPINYSKNKLNSIKNKLNIIKKKTDF